MRPKKRFAQHWLKSDAILNQIVQAAKLSDSDRLLEIGPGMGVLTRKLIPLVNSMIAVELDRELCQYLKLKLANYDNLLLLQADILGLNLADYPPLPNKVVANIPYNITGPILEYLLGKISDPNPHRYELIILLVQKEVADRLCAVPNNKAYGALSLRVQYLAKCWPICSVAARCFSPPPKVDSTVIALEPRLIPWSIANPKLLDTIIKLGFATRRKTLLNNLKGTIPIERLLDIFQFLELNPMIRAENLDLSQWIELSNLINQ